MLGWKGPIRIIEVPIPSSVGHPKSHTMSLKGFSKCCLNSVGLGDVITDLGSLFQVPNHPRGEKVFLDL